MKKFETISNELYTSDREFKEIVRTIKYQPFVIGQKFRLKEVFNYYLSRVPVGFSLHGDNPIFINLKKSKRIMFIGTTGAGKTFFMSGLMDRLLASGAVGFIVDLKGEYVKKHLPLQNDFKKFLMRGEEPRGHNIKVYYPVFMVKITRKRKQKHEHYFQFSLDDITKFDFMTLLPFTAEQSVKPYIDNVWIEIEKGNIRDFDEMIEEIKKIDDMHHTTKKKLLHGIESLVKNGVLGDKYDKPTLIKDLNEGMTVILNLQGITNFPTADNIASAYLAIMIRTLYNAKVQRRLDRTKHHFISIDEINKYCPKIGSGASKYEILKMYDLSRSERISLIGSAQDYKRVPDTLLSQSNYIFIAHNTSTDDAAQLIKTYLPEEYDVPQTFKAKVASIIAGMAIHRDGSRDWMIIDRVRKDYKILKPYAPLTYLIVEGD